MVSVMSLMTMASRSREGSMFSYLLLALCLASYLSTCQGTKRPETTIPQGTVRGVNMATYYNRTVYGFMGVPYAQPPVGDLRFKAPVAPTAWDGILDASNDTQPCAQVGGIGVEDCLHLNVYTPQLPTGDKRDNSLPVIFFVVGGGFKVEDNTHLRYGPDFLLDEDVILVVPNFRVGIFGFLTTGDEAAPGNQGLKDVLRALEWTRDNIKYFGGDPDQITLVGGSTGGIFVELLALSASTKGLFHRYVTQSGSALTPVLQQPAEVFVNRTKQLGEHFGCPTASTTLLVDCLRKINVSGLLDTDSLFHTWRSFPATLWAPTAEPDIEGAFLTDTPAHLFAKGQICDVPWLNLAVPDEGLVVTISLYQNSTLFEEVLTNLDAVLARVVGYEGAVENETAFTDALVSYYLNDLTADRNLLLANFTRLYGDAVMNYPAYSALNHRLSHAETPEYLCSYEYRGKFTSTYFFSGGYTNYTDVVCHADEIIYLFENHNNLMGPPSYEYSEADLTMVKTMVELWTSFVINGTPTTTESTVTWEPYSSCEGYLQIGKLSDVRLEMKYNFLKDRMDFWDDLLARIPWV